MEIFKNKKGQVIGELKEGIFRKKVDKRKHLMRKHNAWGIDFDTVYQLRGKCTEIRIKESVDNVVYKIVFDDFLKAGIAEDYGDGMQCFVPLHEFSTYVVTN